MKGTRFSFWVGWPHASPIFLRDESQGMDRRPWLVAATVVGVTAALAGLALLEAGGRLAWLGGGIGVTLLVTAELLFWSSLERRRRTRG